MTGEPETPAPDSEAPAQAANNFFVVGVGASAGGLEAISDLLRHTPAETGLAIIIVQHLDPTHESLLVELLARVSPLPVHWATNAQALVPGQVYVAPIKSTVTVSHGVIMLEADGRKSGGVINHLFRSLAEDRGEHAIGVILSGSGEDGTLGAKAIKDAGGIVFAQTEGTATFPAMPRAAIETGCVDRVLPPAAIAEELAKLTRASRILWDQLAVRGDRLPDETGADQLAAVFRLLAVRTGVDFSDYKQSTIKRRLVRRMVLAKTPELGDYLKLLLREREEVEALYEGLLINVTEFFRDREFFDFLQQTVFPEMIERHHDQNPIRIWVPGCSSGEEVYSICMALYELIEEKNRFVTVQLFGTDISDRVIATARAGFYSPSDVANVPPERLRRFFTRLEGGFQINKNVREMCVFARQNVIKDAPFSRLDLISCRNLMIYFSTKLQRKLLPVFHYALNPSGLLALGSSESVGADAELFRLIDRRFRLYARKPSRGRPNLGFSVDPIPHQAAPAPKPRPSMADEPKESFEIIGEADRIVLSRHGPVGVLVNDDLEILQFRGDVTPFLAPVEGRASLNLLRMAREGLSTELQSAVQQAREKRTRIQRQGISLMHGDVARLIDIDVTPIEGAPAKERYYLVLFNSSMAESPVAPNKVKGTRATIHLAQIEQLRSELRAVKNFLQAAVERHETTNQELRAANEEIQSSNEELQSTNEELETAREELQSTNEELTTVNEELHSRQLELIQLNNDLNNLIVSVHLPIVILGLDMRIRRLTPMAEKVLNVIPTDVGRPLTDINTNLKVANLPQLMSEVVESLLVMEQEVQDSQGRWYSMRLRPYKTAENRIDGVVLSLIDIDPLKRTIAQLEEARDLAEAVIESAREPMVALNTNLGIEMANEAFYRLFRTTRQRAEGRSFFDAVNEPEKLDQLRQTLMGIIPKRGSLTNHEVQIDLPGTGPTQLMINVHQITSAIRTYPLILISLRPI